MHLMELVPIRDIMLNTTEALLASICATMANPQAAMD